MAKKQRTVRPPRSSDMNRYAGIASSPTAGQPTTAAPAGSPATAGKAAARTTVETDYKAEYYYVTSDLRRIAILAGSMVVVLIVLSFVIK